MFRSYYTTLTGESFLAMHEITLEIFAKYKEYCLMTGNKKQSINKKTQTIVQSSKVCCKKRVDYRKTGCCDHA